MTEETLLPESLGKLEINSPKSATPSVGMPLMNSFVGESLLDSDAQPSLESLSLIGDDCPRESCKCNARSQERSCGTWNTSRRLSHKPVSPTLTGSVKGGIIKKSRFKSLNLRSKSRILREPILKLNSLSQSEEVGSAKSSSTALTGDPNVKQSIEGTSEVTKPCSEHIISQARIFGACGGTPHNDFSSLLPTKSLSEEAKGLKQFSAASYRHLRTSATVTAATPPSKVIKRKKDHRKEGTLKSLPITDSTNTLAARQVPSQASGSQSTTCSQQARMVGPSHVSGDDVTIDELASYFDLFVHIPRKMSHMAENMYI